MVTLSNSLLIATSALSATQTQLSITSGNIANADSEGYTVKSASLTSSSFDGIAAGVDVGEITSQVSQYLLADLFEATSDTAAALVSESYLSSTQSALGTVSDDNGDGSSLSNTIADLETALTDLAATPESTSLASAAVTALEDVTNQINDLADTIANQITDANDQIQSDVEAANEIIETIQSLNESITAADANGTSTADLEDDLNLAMVELSEYLEIATFQNDDGSVNVYTNSGQILVGSQAHLLTTGTDSNGNTTISVNGQEITDSINNGEIGALLELRDETLPGYIEALDELALTFQESLNNVQPGLITGSSAASLGVDDSFLSDPTLLLGTSDEEITAVAFLDALQGESSFDAAGGVSAGDMSFSDYTTKILTAIVDDYTSATNSLDSAQEDLTSIEDTMSSLYGVNVDEESARLEELQQLYSLASTLISVVQEMFDELRSAVS